MVDADVLFRGLMIGNLNNSQRLSGNLHHCTERYLIRVSPTVLLEDRVALLAALVVLVGIHSLISNLLPFDECHQICKARRLIED